jgi:hypothetical protein
MSKVLTVDKALEILSKAKKRVGGDAALVLSLTASELYDINVNNMVIRKDKDNRYVEVQVKHDELAKQTIRVVPFVT